MSEKIRNMFSIISKKYDLLNDVLSFGVHHIWRKKLVRLADPQKSMKIFDAATGTGDLAIAFCRLTNNQVDVVATDFCPEMFEIGKIKNEKLKYNIKFEFADAMNIEYNDGIFDISTIAFGIRNVDDTKKGISELGRIVKPGGKVLVLEFGQPNKFVNFFYSIYSGFIIPFLGSLISGNKAAYKYLHNSAAVFPSRENFLKIMDSTGKFSHTSYKVLSLGIAYIYVGVVK